MSINEMESKARELRQLQALIDEAQAEAEAIKDSLKAAMGDSEAVQAGEYKDYMEACKVLQNRRTGLEKGSPRYCGAVHQNHDHPPLCRGIKK